MMKSLETLHAEPRSEPAGRIVPGVTWRRRLAAPAFASLLVLAACGGADDAGTEPDEPAVTAADPSAAAPADTAASASAPTAASDVDVPAALQFTAPAVGGGQIDVAASAGTPTVFWFWAPT